MTPDALLALLQFADGLFPAGGFAHSLGLETCVQAGAVRDREGLEALVRAHLEGSSGPGDAVAVAVAARAAVRGDLAACVEADRRLDAMRCVPESRAASLQMGRQTARVAAAAGGDAFVRTLAGAIEDGATPGHHAVAFGAVTARRGVEPGAAAAAYLHATATMLVSAGLRLLPLGQVDGQRTLAALQPVAARLAREAAGASLDDLWGFAPGLEIAGLRHAGLEGRLFRS